MDCITNIIKQRKNKMNSKRLLLSIVAFMLIISLAAALVQNIDTHDNHLKIINHIRSATGSKRDVSKFDKGLSELQMLKEKLEAYGCYKLRWSANEQLQSSATVNELKNYLAVYHNIDENNCAAPFILPGETKDGWHFVKFCNADNIILKYQWNTPSCMTNEKLLEDIKSTIKNTVPKKI